MSALLAMQQVEEDHSGRIEMQLVASEL